MTDTVPWAIFRRGPRPSSRGRYLLCELLEIYCWHQWDQDPEDIVAIATGTADEDTVERDALRSTIAFLGSVVLDGEIATFVRRIGGGPCDALPPSRWELDDFEARFAVSALCLERWWDPAAEPTHWIFADGDDVDRFMDRWLNRVPGSGAEEEAPAATNSVAAADLRIVRLPEVQAMTGLSRSTIYAKMAAGDFPRRVALGARMAGWYEHDVIEWIRAPR